jgi:hypothetical protein
LKYSLLGFQRVYKKRHEYSNGTLTPHEVHSQEGENPEANISTGEIIRLLQHVLFVNIACMAANTSHVLVTCHRYSSAFPIQQSTANVILNL